MTRQRSAMHLSSNFEEFAALLHGFDMDICQLERGAFSASSHQVFFGETMLSPTLESIVGWRSTELLQLAC